MSAAVASASPWSYRGAANGSYGSISALQFDPELELMWLGDVFGFVSTFVVGPPVHEELAWQLYSSFRVFKDTCLAIEPLSYGKEATMCIASSSSIRVVKRGGFVALRSEIKNSVQRRITAVTCDPKSNTVYIGGETPGILRMSVAAPDELATIPSQVESATSALKLLPDYLLVGYANGDIVLRSPKSLAENAVIRGASHGRVTAFDQLDEHVFVASAVVDRQRAVVKFFDVRKTGAGAFHSVDVAGPTVGLSSFETLAPDAPGSRHVMQLFSNGYNILSAESAAPLYSSSGVDGSCTAIAMSRNKRCCAIGSDKGFFFSLSNKHCGHEFQNVNGAQVRQAIPPKFTTSWSENKDGVVDQDFDYSVPEEQLFSSWPPPHYMITSGEPKYRPIHSRIPVGTLGMNRWGIKRSDVYQPDPKDKLDRVIPNPYPFNMLVGDDPSKVTEVLPKLQKRFRAEFGRTKSDLGMYTKPDDANQVCYHGDFDWKQYNSSGCVVTIDNSIFESWVVPIVHIMFNLQPPYYPLRKMLARHLCKKPYCVSCELSFMFNNMCVQLQTMATPIVPAHNLLTALRRMPELVEAGIFVRPNSRDEAVSKLHVLQVWLLKQLEADFRQMALDYPALCRDFEVTSLISNTFGTEFQAVKHTIAPQFHWEVPASAAKVDEGLQHLLKQLETFNGEQVQIKRLPPILVLLLNPEHGNLKPPGSLKFSRPPKEEYNYILTGNVIHLADDADDPGHFVTHCKVTSAGEFVLINDYFVSGRASEEVLEGHIPAVTTHSVVLTYYVLDTFKGPKVGGRDSDGRFHPVPLNEVAGELLLSDFYAGAIQQRKPVLPSPIKLISSFDELQNTHIVALDAEYVVLDWCNRIESDEPEWMRRQRKNNMSLARLSCILSRFPGDEQTIVDDFVETCEKVQDYVTQYSGIHEGDLDPAVSRCNLTVLKATYLKLRALVDRGVRLLGHGLAQDFRVLNIAVPQAQVIDTLNIFSRDGHRKLSLRFLAYHVLNERVQEDCHDSVEDARTALRLYRRYEELLAAGRFDDEMDRLVTIGYATNYSVPTNGAASERSPPRPTSRTPEPESGRSGGTSPAVSSTIATTPPAADDLTAQQLPIAASDAEPVSPPPATTSATTTTPAAAATAATASPTSPLGAPEQSQDEIVFDPSKYESCSDSVATPVSVAAALAVIEEQSDGSSTT